MSASNPSPPAGEADADVLAKLEAEILRMVPHGISQGYVIERFAAAGRERRAAGEGPKPVRWIVNNKITGSEVTVCDGEEVAWCASQVDKFVVTPLYAAAPRVSESAGAKIIEKIKQTLEQASEERYQFLKEREAESEKWKAEGDMYGWNFHQGMAAGANWCDIFYHRVGREIDAVLDAKKGGE